MPEPSFGPARDERVVFSPFIAPVELLVELREAVDAGDARETLILAGILLGSLEPQSEPARNAWLP